MLRPNHSTVLLAAALLAAGCDTGFDPPSYLKDLRVLAVLASPLEAGPGDVVTLRPHIYLPRAASITAVEWSFCPLTLGARSAFRCVLPACETPLVPAADNSVTANPLALAETCLAAVAGSGSVPTGSTLPQMIDTVFRLRVTASDGAVEQVIERYPVWPFAAPPARNRPPAISGITANGAAPDTAGVFAPAAPLAEVTIEVAIDPQSLDAFTDANGDSHTEDPVVSFYATAGRFKRDRANGTRGNVIWKAEKLGADDFEAVVYVVARDLRGGQTLAGPYRIPIARGHAAAW
jgi:hypothetical protein